jgi:lysophospholipase L1-like esterase
MLPNTIGGSFLSSVAASKLSITPATAIDNFEIWYATSGTQGTFTVDIDGGAVLETVNAAGSNGYVKKTYTVARGIHTVNITKTGANNTNIVAFRSWDSLTPQIEIIMAGSSGADSSLFVNVAQPWEALNQITAHAGDLVYIDCTINDAQAGTVVATYKSRLQTVINAVVAAGGDVILGTGNPYTIATTALATQRSYITACSELAVTNNIPFINSFSLFRSYEIANPGGLMTDTLHPNFDGYEMQATLLFDLLAAVR